MRIGTAVAIRGPLPDVREQAALVDALGYDSVWVPEVAGRDALVTCAALAGDVARARLATGIVPLPARSPVTLAMGAATLAEVTGGRFVLGVGAGHRETGETWLGRPALGLAAVAEHLEVLAAVLHEGGVRRPPGVSLPALDFQLRGVQPPAPPAVVLAALGPRTAALAGSLADGLVANWATAAHARRLADWAREAAAAAGRDPDALEIACYVPVCVGPPDEARAALARQLDAYGRLAAYRRVLVASGLDADDRGQDALDALGAHGDEGEVRARLEEYAAAGVTLAILAPYPVGEDPWASMTGTWAALSPDG
ncbi:MAG: LLM class flavin-dependent oxidoreductase [Acidimicrobiales bacterium]|nr:LLM class flavin-dependent oxidoreductase [Acidimicrobiales bacterium]